MAGEEDTELRDLVAQTLETQGVLGRIRAQLRANVFIALEQDKKDKPSQASNTRFDSFMQTEDGRLTASLVREFLQFFELDFTCSVFDPETKVLQYYNGRDKLASDMNLSAATDSPLLLQLLKRARTTPNLVTMSTDHTPLPPSSASSSDKATPTTTLPPPTQTPLSSINQSTTLRHSTALTLTGTGASTDSPVTPITMTTVLSQASGGISTAIPSSAGTISTGATSLISTGAQDGAGKSTLGTASGGELITGLLDQHGSDLGKGASALKSSAFTKAGSGGDDSDDDTVSSQKWAETTDHSLSQSTLADEEFDHTEQVQ